MRVKGSSLPLFGKMGPRKSENCTAVLYCTCRQEPSAKALCLDRGRCEHLAASRQGGAPHPTPTSPGWAEEQRPLLG